jgi:hypothetical protein
MRQIGALGVVVLFMTWFPVVALLVVLGVAFGWMLPVAFVLAWGFLIAMSMRSPREVGRVRAAVEFAGFALLGGVIGGLLLGGLGAIFGMTLGFIGRLSEVPITGGPSFRFLRRKTRDVR